MQVYPFILLISDLLLYTPSTIEFPNRSAGTSYLLLCREHHQRFSKLQVVTDTVLAC